MDTQQQQPLPTQNQQNQQNQLKPKPVIVQKSKPFVKKGRYLSECSGVYLVVYEYYQIIKRVGDGAYGVVFKAMNKNNNNEFVAIKKMTEAFRDPRDAKRILREIKLLKFCDHPNIIKLKDIIKPERPTGYKDIYLVLEFMEIDLDKTINSQQPLAPRLIQSLMWQLLNAIYYMHSADIIHRDIKPSNILLLKNCTLKLADMNLARKFDIQECITEYVVTRYYRAPEVLLSTQSYSKPIDIWSVGCIFAEMMGRKTIFKGASQMNQLDRIIAIIGKPDIDKLSYKIDQNMRAYFQNIPNKQPENFYEIYKNHDKLAVELLYNMLAFDPKQRWTVEQCLYHPYFASFNKSTLKACNVKFDWSFDEIQVRNEVIQRAIYEESCEFHPDEVDASEEDLEAHAKQQLLQKQMQQSQLAAQQQTQFSQQMASARPMFPVNFNYPGSQQLPGPQFQNGNPHLIGNQFPQQIINPFLNAQNSYPMPGNFPKMLPFYGQGLIQPPMSKNFNPFSAQPQMTANQMIDPKKTQNLGEKIPQSSTLPMFIPGMTNFPAGMTIPNQNGTDFYKKPNFNQKDITEVAQQNKKKDNQAFSNEDNKEKTNEGTNGKFNGTAESEKNQQANESTGNKEGNSENKDGKKSAEFPQELLMSPQETDNLPNVPSQLVKSHTFGPCDDGDQGKE